MGQYFKGVYVIPGTTEIITFLESWDFNNGAKIVEHAYIGNNFVESFEYQLREGGMFHKQGVVWAGDFSERFEEEGTLHETCHKNEEKVTTAFPVGGGKVVRPCSGEERMELFKCPKGLIEEYPYLVNHTKGYFVDKRKVKSDEFGYTVHPLPILCCDSYTGYGDENQYTGFWRGDSISIENQVPDDYIEMDFQHQFS